MSFKITIINNENGEVIAHEEDALAIVGAIKTEEYTQRIGFTSCDPFILAETIVGAEKTICKLKNEHKELNFLTSLIESINEQDYEN